MADDNYSRSWIATPQTRLEGAIERFKRDLPGWWYSVCECQVSCDASCAPTRQSPHIAQAVGCSPFNEGFHADLPQPSTLAEALDTVREEALSEITRLTTPVQESV